MSGNGIYVTESITGKRDQTNQKVILALSDLYGVHFEHRSSMGPEEVQGHRLPGR